MGFVVFHCTAAAARHIVPVRASDALISISNSISLYPYPDRFNTACFEVGQIMRGEAAGYVRIFWIYNTAYINRSKNVWGVDFCSSKVMVLERVECAWLLYRFCLVMSGVITPYVAIVGRFKHWWSPCLDWLWVLKRDLLKQLKHVETRKQDGLKHVETICRECSLCRLHILQVRVVILVIWDDTFACRCCARMRPQCLLGASLGPPHLLHLPLRPSYIHRTLLHPFSKDAVDQNVCCANLSWPTPSLTKWRVSFRNTLHNFAQHMCRRVCSWRVAEVTAAQPVFLQFQTTYSFHGLLLSHFGNSYHLPPSPALKMQKLEAEQKCRGQLMAQCDFMIFHASSLFLGIRG